MSRAGRGGVSQLRNRVLFCRFTRMYIPPAEIRHGHVLARQCCLDRFEACFGEETLSLFNKGIPLPFMPPERCMCGGGGRG